MSILRLPEEIFVAILDFLPVASIQHLSATCQKLYERIHQNDPYWSRKLRHEYRLNLNRTFMGNFAFDGLIEVSKCLQYSKYYVNSNLFTTSGSPNIRIPILFVFIY